MTIFPDPLDSDMQIVQVNVADEITVTLSLPEEHLWAKDRSLTIP